VAVSATFDVIVTQMLAMERMDLVGPAVSGGRALVGSSFGEGNVVRRRRGTRCRRIANGFAARFDRLTKSSASYRRGNAEGKIPHSTPGSRTAGRGMIMRLRTRAWVPECATRMRCGCSRALLKESCRLARRRAPTPGRELVTSIETSPGVSAIRCLQRRVQKLDRTIVSSAVREVPAVTVSVRRRILST